MKIIARIGLMRWIFTAFFLLSVSISTYYAEAADTVTVTFYHTSDIHENSANLPQIARLVREQRECKLCHMMP
jgi:2',3'-cyclic-nucleotide 2'-phosphodiesterase (5'-nucleotidase family)